MQRTGAELLLECLLASAYGFYAERVEKTEHFPAAFERAMQSTTGAVLDLVTSIEALTPLESLQSIRINTQAAAKPRT